MTLAAQQAARFTPQGGTSDIQQQRPTTTRERTRGGVVCGGADDLHAALVRAVVRPRALKGGQEGVMDVCGRDGGGGGNKDWEG